MGFDVKTDDGGSYYAVFPQRQDEKAAQEYERFRGCIAQLLDDETMVGDVDGRWIVFQNGWVYGMATYPTKEDAVAFGKQMFRDEPGATYIVVQVDCDAHAITAMHILGSAMTDGPGFDLSTTPDEINRPANGEGN